MACAAEDFVAQKEELGMYSIVLFAFLAMTGQNGAKGVDVAVDLRVDYDRSVKSGVVAGGFSYANTGIDEKKFPAAPDEKGKAYVSFRTVAFDRDMTPDEATVQIKKAGYRPATLREALAFGEQHGKLLNDQELLCLGAICFIDGTEYLVSLRKNGGKKSLFLWGLNRKFKYPKEYRYLAVAIKG